MECAEEAEMSDGQSIAEGRVLPRGLKGVLAFLGCSVAMCIAIC